MTLKNFAFWPVQSMCHHVCCRCGFCKGVPFLSLFFFAYYSTGGDASPQNFSNDPKREVFK